MLDDLVPRQVDHSQWSHIVFLLEVEEVVAIEHKPAPVPCLHHATLFTQPALLEQRRTPTLHGHSKVGMSVKSLHLCSFSL